MNASAQDPFVAAWHRREPEMALAEVFCPPPLRDRFRAWGALVNEVRTAVFELSDPRVTAVKVPWWAEELLRFGSGAGRHPLAAPLAAPGPGGSGEAAPWRDLAAAMLRVAHDTDRPADGDAALAQVRPLADAIAAVETALFPASRPSDAAGVAVHLLLHRLPQGLGDDDRARVPLGLLARHGLTPERVAAGEGDAVLRDWAAWLHAKTPPDLRGQPLFRRLRGGLDAIALRRLAAGRGFAPEPAPVVVWRAWRLARRA